MKNKMSNLKAMRLDKNLSTAELGYIVFENQSSIALLERVPLMLEKLAVVFDYEGDPLDLLRPYEGEPIDRCRVSPQKRRYIDVNEKQNEIIEKFTTSRGIA